MSPSIPQRDTEVRLDTDVWLRLMMPAMKALAESPNHLIAESTPTSFNFIRRSGR